MTDRVYPSKPATNGTAAAHGGNPSFPANKAQLYNTTRPAYRPQPHHSRRRGRSCCCSFCLCITLFFITLIVLATVAGAVLWVLYRPHRPSFSVSSLRISQFNFTSSSQLNSKFNLTVTAQNPNKKLVFFYDPMKIKVTADGINVGDGSIPAFVHGTKNTTTLRSTITSSAQSMDSTSISTLKSDLKNKNGLDLKIQLDTKVKVKIGGLKTTKVAIRVSCKGIKAAVPTGKTSTTATTSDAKCKVYPRIKIWKWTI
ncbi:NDR1/HIN1-like protein 6 [Cornus florida]|uniref:NDR1/HIN1-like protein 6 n=1 Tax=Cornus florida TaxID=4283 RepID=UPI002899429B|nr:NDR1/HIN1-like protein 6 [Cornus florida]